MRTLLCNRLMQAWELRPTIMRTLMCSKPAMPHYTRISKELGRAMQCSGRIETYEHIAKGPATAARFDVACSMQEVVP